jgi:hypothetical protein
MDLLAYSQELVNKGHLVHTQTSAYLQSVIKSDNSPVKPTNGKKPNSYQTPLLAGGVIAVVVGAVMIGYL